MDLTESKLVFSSYTAVYYSAETEEILYSERWIHNCITFRTLYPMANPVLGSALLPPSKSTPGAAGPILMPSNSRSKKLLSQTKISLVNQN